MGTQYDKGNLTRIYTTDGNWKLLEDAIDWWALWQFLLRLHQKRKSKGSQYIIYKDLFDLVIKKAGIKPHSKDYIEFYMLLSVDETRKYLHQTHGHLNMRD